MSDEEATIPFEDSQPETQSYAVSSPDDRPTARSEDAAIRGPHLPSRRGLFSELESVAAIRQGTQGSSEQQTVAMDENVSNNFDEFTPDERAVLDQLAVQSSPASLNIAFKSIFENEWRGTFLRKAGWQEELRDRHANNFLPWMEEYNGIYSLEVFKKQHHGYTLFDTTAIHHTINNMRGEELHMYLLDLFFQKRYFSSRKSHSDKITAEALSESWTAFVKQFNSDPNGWLKNLVIDRSSFMTRTLVGKKMNVHLMCINAKLPCGVARELKCPMCYSNSKKLPETAYFRDTSAFCVPDNIRQHIISLREDCRAKEEADARKRLDEQSKLRDQQDIHDIKGDILRVRKELNDVKMIIKRLEVQIENTRFNSDEARNTAAMATERLEEMEAVKPSRIRQIEHNLQAMSNVVKKLMDNFEPESMTPRKRKV